MSSTVTGTPEGDTVAPAVVEFIDVEKTYAAGTAKAYTAIKDLSFRVDDRHGEGEFISIVGPSGCGKSTILNLIQGFADVAPATSGQVLVRGEPVVGPGVDRGMIFQKYSSFPNRTVLSNVTFGLEVNRERLGLTRPEMDGIARHWIQRVGLAEHEHKYPHQLSGGQQQRVAIARTLALKPPVILMDEPFSALDEPTRFEMQRLITALWQEIEATVFIVTHSIVEAVFLGDRVWIITPAPGRMGREFNDIIPPTHGVDPILMYEKQEFKEAVSEVVHAFHEIESGGRDGDQDL